MIPNFRDVGMTVNLVADKELLRENVLFRGGTINDLFGPEEMPPLNLVLNLRKGVDKDYGIKNIQVPAVDSVQNYQTSNGMVRKWINQSLTALFDDFTAPALIHCTAGRDRTGVVIAAILLLVGIEKRVIIDEYMMSDGLKSDENIITALDGFADISAYVYDKSLSKTIATALLV